MSDNTGAWAQTFQELMREVKPWHAWTLTMNKNLLPTVLKSGWKQYQQRTFARFPCSLCCRDWASAQVLVLFHMHWNKEKVQGRVKMRVFAQRCQRCFQSPFEVPEFTEQNISRILSNLVLHILTKCYCEGFRPMAVTPTLKDLALQGPHDHDNCEACLQGCCGQLALDPGLQPPGPSLPCIRHKGAWSDIAPAAVIGICAPPGPKIVQLAEPTFSPDPCHYPQIARAPKPGDTPGSSITSGFPIPQVPPTHLPRPKIATRPPSSANRSTLRTSAPGETGRKGRGRLPRSSLFAQPPQAARPPGSQNPRVGTSYEVLTRDPDCPSREDFYSHTSLVRSRRAFWSRCCCLILTVVVVVVKTAM